MAQFKFGILDFICPLEGLRASIDPDYCIWMDTIRECEFEDTNQMFVNPKNFDFRVTTQDAKYWAPKNDKDIQPGERAYFTQENALIIDKMMSYITTNVEEKYRPFFVGPLLV